MSDWSNWLKQFRKVNMNDSSNKNKLTLKHAIWSTFYILITGIGAILVSTLIIFLIDSGLSKEDFLIIFPRLTPFFYISCLVVLFLYIGTRTGLDLSCLGFKKSGLKQALIAGFIAWIILGLE